MNIKKFVESLWYLLILVIAPLMIGCVSFLMGYTFKAGFASGWMLQIAIVFLFGFASFVNYVRKL